MPCCVAVQPHHIYNMVMALTTITSLTSSISSFHCKNNSFSSKQAAKAIKKLLLYAIKLTKSIFRNTKQDYFRKNE
jgi:hypothetical protein